MSADLKKKAIECRLGHSKKHTLHSHYHPLLEEYTPQIPHTSGEDYMMALHEVLPFLG